ncbi:hypothetical protein [Streptacidiphilus sp. EB103A]|uniref:hypothetical protein n=1 Tax=Streptacidiphilus sp. EB103A TaxID=3156275 RepID=UPI003511825F
MRLIDLDKNSNVIAEHVGAGSSAEVDFWVHRHQVPWDRVSATDAARAVLGRR